MLAHENPKSMFLWLRFVRSESDHKRQPEASGTGLDPGKLQEIPKRIQQFVLMIQGAKLPNGDASEVRRVFQETAVSAIVE
jgi:hypothetical protein